MLMSLAIARMLYRIPYTSYRLIYVFEKVAPRDGFEPPAKRLTVACSTAELPGNNQWQKANSVAGLYQPPQISSSDVIAHNHNFLWAFYNGNVL